MRVEIEIKKVRKSKRLASSLVRDVIKNFRRSIKRSSARGIGRISPELYSKAFIRKLLFFLVAISVILHEPLPSILNESTQKSILYVIQFSFSIIKLLLNYKTVVRYIFLLVHEIGKQRPI